MGLERQVGTVLDGRHQYTVLGRGHQLQVDDHAPDFKLKYIDPVTNELGILRLSDFNNSVLILHLAGGLSLTYKATTAHDLDVLRKGLDVPGEVLKTVTVSLDPHQRLADIRRRHKISHLLASALDTPTKFALEHGALIRYNHQRFLGEATFVIAQRTIRYADYLEDMAQKPNFFKPLEVAKTLSEDVLMDMSLTRVLAEFSSKPS